MYYNSICVSIYLFICIHLIDVPSFPLQKIAMWIEITVKIRIANDYNYFDWNSNYFKIRVAEAKDETLKTLSSQNS